MTDFQNAIERLRNPPRLIYSILHQAWPDLAEGAYTDNVLALHRRIRLESHRFRDALVVSEEGHPGASDSFRPQADPRRYPPLDSRQYRFVFPEVGGASLRRHIPEGSKYLQGLGFVPGDPGTLHETEFHLSGSPVLDFLEVTVRDLVGIDRGVHGAQIRALSSVCFMLRNQVLEVGRREDVPSQWAVLYFEKPGAPGTISYDIFRAALRTILEDHRARGSFSYACLHQRKLGLGRGSEFSLRVQLPLGPGPALDIFLHDLFHEEGALEALRFGLAIQEEIPVPLDAAPRGLGYNDAVKRHPGPAPHPRDPGEITMSALSAGTPAPDFRLKNYDGTEVTLAQFRGKRSVLLAFFPLAFTPVCSCQIPSYRDDLARFESLDCQPIAIGISSVPAHKAWVDSLGGVNIPVLSDFYPHGEVARRYGVLREEGFPERSLFLIDRQGVIRYSLVHELRRQPDNNVILEEIKKLR